MFCLLALTLATSLNWKGPPRIGYVAIGAGARILPALYDRQRPSARTEITSGGVVTFVRETPEQIARAAVDQCTARLARVEAESQPIP